MQEAEELLEELGIVEKLEPFIASALESIERSRQAEIANTREKLGPFFKIDTEVPEPVRGVSPPPAHLLEKMGGLRKPALERLGELLGRALKHRIDARYRTIGSTA
ncbi:hypothetical protein CL654_02130 [bacterium]|nr:hypothetical protein [bacterium]